MTWQSIFKSGKMYQVEIVRAVLAERDMNPVIIDKLGVHNLGHFEVHVPVEHVLQAIKIINDDISFS
jgi:hypothetical protein